MLESWSNKKTFPTKAQALAWEHHIRAKVLDAPDWSPPKRDARTLRDLCDLWFKHHGSGLQAGIDTHRRLLAMSDEMGNPRADLFTATAFAEYRTKRLDAGVTPNTLNREQSYMRAVFNELIRLDLWNRDNPLKKMRAFKIQEKELTYLTLPQIKKLLDTIKQGRNPHTELVARICLSTGARWGEAEGLRISQVRSEAIQFVKTKSSKARSVPITADLEKAIHAHHVQHDNLGDRIFSSCASAFRDGVDRASIILPDGQLTHVLRHTFASHFMMNGGNILALQKALGHHDLKMTMRYAHLSPGHLAETRRLNPLTLLESR